MSSILLPLVPEESSISTPLLGHVYIYVNKDNKVCIKSDTGVVQILDFDPNFIVDHISTPLDSATVTTPIRAGSIILVEELPEYHTVQSLVELPITFRVLDVNTGEYYDTTYYGSGSSMTNKTISSNRISVNTAGFNTIPVTATTQTAVNSVVDTTLGSVSETLDRLLHLENISMTYNPATTSISIINGDNSVLTTLSLLPLLNKIDIRYNPTTKSLEIWDEGGNKLDEDIPLIDIISGVVSNASWSTDGELRYLDSTGKQVFSVVHSIDTVKGLSSIITSINSQLQSLSTELGETNATVSSLSNAVSSNTTELNKLQGIQISYNTATKTLELKDKNNTLLTSVSLVTLDDEGTDFRYNATTKSLELWNGSGIMVDTIPVVDFVKEVATTIELNGNILNLKDSSGGILSSVSIGVSSVDGLQTALNGKLSVPSLNNNSIPYWDGTNFGSSNLSNTTTGISVVGGISLQDTPQLDGVPEYTGIYATTTGIFRKLSPTKFQSLTGLGTNRVIDYVAQGYKFNFSDESTRDASLDASLDILESPRLKDTVLKNISRNTFQFDGVDNIDGLYPQMYSAGALFKFNKRQGAPTTYGMYLGADGILYTRGINNGQYSGKKLLLNSGDNWGDWNVVLTYISEIGVYVGEGRGWDTNEYYSSHSIINYDSMIQRGAFLSPKLSQSVLSQFSTKLTEGAINNGIVVYNTDTNTYLQYKDGIWLPLGIDASIYNTDGIIKGNRTIGMNGDLEFKTNGNPFKITGLKNISTAEDLENFSKVVRQNPTTKELATGNATEIIITHPDTVTVNGNTTIANVNVNYTVTNFNVTGFSSKEFSLYKKIMKKLLTYDWTIIEDYNFTVIIPDYAPILQYTTKDTANGKLVILNNLRHPSNNASLNVHNTGVLSTPIATIQIGGEYQIQNGMIFKLELGNTYNKHSKNDIVVEDEAGNTTTLLSIINSRYFEKTAKLSNALIRYDDKITLLIYYYNKKFFVTASYYTNNVLSHNSAIFLIDGIGTTFKLKYLHNTHDDASTNLISILGKYTILDPNSLEVIEDDTDIDTLLGEFDSNVQLTKMSKNNMHVTKIYPDTNTTVDITDSTINILGNVNNPTVPSNVIVNYVKSDVNFPMNKNWMISYTVKGIPRGREWAIGMGNSNVNVPTHGVLSCVSENYYYFNGTHYNYGTSGNAVTVTVKKVNNIIVATIITGTGQTSVYNTVVPAHLLNDNANFNFILNTQTAMRDMSVTLPEYYIQP